MRGAILLDGFTHLGCVAHARVYTLIVEHLSALALLIRADMTDKVCRLEDILPTNHNFAQFVCRIAGGCIQTAVIVIHFPLNVIRFIRLVDALVHRAAIDIG